MQNEIQIVRVGLDELNYSSVTKAILMSEALAAMMRGEQGEGDDAHPAFKEEFYHLMVFLNKAYCSYCTVDALTES
ncbi:hypothetical protein DL766_006434 [Monosporascus sp. MC13-8B]|nr:hypothetical protein DL763_003110 [Monosporascus cannonballus]RYP27372.1 hypothetical protein DL766_006434 [Monosporascus sp. MC13-8B]